MTLTRVLEARMDAASAEVLRRFIVAHVVTGLDRIVGDGSELVRSVDVHGRTHLARVRWEDEVVVVDTDAQGADVGEVAAIISRWLDLRGPRSDENSTLEADSRLRDSVHAFPGMRIPGAVAGLETALFAILGQQVSLAAARTFAGRLVRFAGVDRGDGLYSSPSAELIRDAEPEEFRAALGITRTRARTIQTLASAVADGLVLSPGDELASTRAAILALPGIGTWTTEYVALRCLGDRDAFPGGDLVLRRQLGVATEREALREAEPWRPARGLAVLHLWTAAVFT